jgi:hypothetical protein
MRSDLVGGHDPQLADGGVAGAGDHVATPSAIIAVVNKLLMGQPPAGSMSQDAEPLFFLIGSPMRGIAGSDARVTHLEAWRLPALGAALASSLLQR